MRTLTTSLAFITLLAAAGTQASDPTSLQGFKTGVLPGGGTYRLYDVQCTNQTSASVARLDGGQRWCTGSEGQLDCFRQSADATAHACERTDRLASREAIDTGDTFQ